MTTGQRIAAKRKEQNLSQEALGEKLGVSRQSIYKWEADVSLPEIEKLVSLSRLFHVPVGWLLGVEDIPEAVPEGFTDQQVKVIEEIFQRYQRPQELTEEQKAQIGDVVRRRMEESAADAVSVEARRQRRWPKVLAACLLCGTAGVLFHRLAGIENEYDQISMSVREIADSVNREVNGITGRVEAILKAQNNLLADSQVVYDEEDLDPAKDQVILHAEITPKTWTQGLRVRFVTDYGEGTMETEATEQENHRFEAEIPCPLTDSITVSAVLTEGETEQTQFLETFQLLEQLTYPESSCAIFHLTSTQKDDVVVRSGYVHVEVYPYYPGQARVEQVEIGLFRDQRLEKWLNTEVEEDGEMLSAVADFTDRQPADSGEAIFAAILTDEYGRQWMTPPAMLDNGTGSQAAQPEPQDDTLLRDPAYWGL